MSEFLTYLIIAGLWIYGIYAAFESKYIFGKINAWCHMKLMWKGKNGGLVDKTWILKPLFMCNVCMSSFWGGTLGLIFFGLSFKVILFIGCLAGLMYISNLILPE